MTTKYFKAVQAEILGHLDSARDIADAAERAGRDLTGDEIATVKHHLDQAKQLKPKLAKAKAEADKDAALDRQLGLLSADVGLLPEQDGPRFTGYTPTGAKRHPGHAWGKAVVKTASDGVRFKGVVANDVTLVDVPAPPIITLGQPVLSLRQLIPAVPTDGVYSYLRQTTRTFNAAPVAPGGLKPESVLETTLVNGRAVTIAHTTQPVPRQHLSDAAQLEAFISSELAWGWEREVENQVINGDGTGENLLGVANTSGVLTQAYAVNLITTTRKAITALENQGITPTGWALAPSDWEQIELSASTTGNLLLADSGSRVPVESAARRLWGYPVVASPAVAVGTGYLADWTGSTQLFMREEVNIRASEAVYDPDALGAGVGASDFQRNLVRYLAEGRVGFGVLRPSGVVKIDLSA
ncbi:phage major capsid protein [Dactylosporangium sp. CA-092794]|uniref:phage major capsid protein n=1 Tax=Dactylosporangium sp. CA-092794 TaxID=3239929 RepID=UPI003D8AD21E